MRRGCANDKPCAWRLPGPGLTRTSTTDDATHAKRFWSAVEGGGKYRVYEQQVSSKIVDLTVEHYSNVLITSTVGLRKLSIT